jgi:putative endonuclease
MSLWPPSKNQGQKAEALAEVYLQRQGLQRRERNYRCKAGEIDLIMSQGEILVFVEVRLRSNARFASAVESVDARKQQKLLRAAQSYLLQRRLTDKVQCRFDVVAFNRGLDPEGIAWLPNAFGA